MSLIEQLNADLKTAMKAKDKAQLTVIRSLKSALTNAQIDAGHDLSDDEAISVLSTQLKQRKESLVDFKRAQRTDLVDQITAEIEFVKAYLPKQLDASEVAAIVDEAIAQTGASSKADFGKVMQAVMPRVKGIADGALVQQTVKAKLG